ncbi:hypothetical protein FI667_g14563, partial [Globisporangium splendens]
MVTVGTAATANSIVEGEEALLQIYELQWRAIEIQSKQLQNQCRQVVLDEELDREERKLLLEHEALLRIKEKQILQQQYEDRFRLKEAEDAARKLQRQNEQKRKRQETATIAAATAVETETEAVATMAKTKATTAIKSKVVVPAVAEGKTSAANTVNGDIVRRQKKVAAKSVAFSPRKIFPAKTPHSSSHTARPRSLEESFDTEQEADVNDTPTSAKKSAADELMLMLSQDKASDTEGEEPSLLMPFSPPILTPVKNVPEPRYLSYGTPDRAEPKESNNPTPSKFTPSKLAKGVMKKAMAATEDFDFTLRAAKAKAQAEKEAQAAKEAQQAADESDEEEEQATSSETPKKALKRRKDLGISFSNSSSSSNKTLSKSNGNSKTVAEDTSSSAGSRGGKSLMEMVAAASLVESKIPKPKEMPNQPAKDSATSVPTATATENGKPPLYGSKKAQSKQSAKTKEAEADSSSDHDENSTDQSKSKAASNKVAKKDAKSGNSKFQSQEGGTVASAGADEPEDFIGVKAANITKRVRPKQQKQRAKEKEIVPGNADEPEAEVSVAKKKKTTQEKQPKEKGKKKDKLSAVEQAIAKADMLTRMSRMQDIATPKVLAKKKKKAFSKTAADSLPAKRAKILANGSATSDSDDAGTPRKQRAMKRQLATSRENETTPVKKTVQVPSSAVNHLHSPSITALLAMRPSKSPIGIRYVPKTPKTPKTPQTVRSKRQRPAPSNADEDALNNDSPDAKKRKSRSNAAGAPDRVAAPMSTAEYAAQKLSAGLVTRAQKKAVKAARSAFTGTTGALTSAGGGLWGNSGPSFFDAFVNGGAPRLKKSVLR